jgi:hypothetical protein
MQSILKLKHWQLFLIQVVGYFCYANSLEDELFRTILSAFGIFIMTIWILAIGIEASIYISRNNLLFSVNYLLIICLYVFLVMSGVNKIYFSGIYAIMALYLLFAVLHVYVFPASTLKNLFLTKTRTERMSTFIIALLIIFWPIGLWILQPKINRTIKELDILEQHAEENIKF